jgi:hypothetical protein
VELLQLDNGPYEYDVLPHILLVEYILGCMVVLMDIHAWLEMADTHIRFLHDDLLGLARSFFCAFRWLSDKCFDHHHTPSDPRPNIPLLTR